MYLQNAKSLRFVDTKQIKPQKRITFHVSSYQELILAELRTFCKRKFTPEILVTTYVAAKYLEYRLHVMSKHVVPP